MNILVVTDLIPVFENEKGLPLTILSFCEGFKSLGHNVFVLRSNFIPNTLLRRRKIQKEGLYNYKNVDILNKNFWLPDFDFEFNAKFDAVAAHMPAGILCAHKIAKKLNLPFICSVHSSDIKVLEHLKYSFYFKDKLKNCFLEADAIAARSPWLLNKITEILPQVKTKAYCAPSGIEEEFILDKEKMIKKFNAYKAKKLKVFCASNFIKRKNILSLIEGAEGFDLEIAGWGKEETKLKKHAKKINFLGRLEQKKVIEKMQGCEIFILPSINETFGMVYLEAMASGCITVCCENTAIAGIIKDGINGFLTKPDSKSINDVLRKIAALDEDKAKNIIENSYETIKHLTKIKAAQNYINIIETSIKNKYH